MKFPTKRFAVPTALLMSAGLVVAGAGTASARVGAPSINKGAQGFNVYCVQTGINFWLEDDGTTPDGSFGPDTLRAVEEFQRQRGLQPDGQVGPLTGTDVWQEVQFLINELKVTGQSQQTPWGVPLSNCYLVLPTTS